MITTNQKADLYLIYIVSEVREGETIFKRNSTARLASGRPVALGAIFLPLRGLAEFVGDVSLNFSLRGAWEIYSWAHIYRLLGLQKIQIAMINLL